MGREIKRVPVGFNWPIDKVWGGYVMPTHLAEENDCEECGGDGYSPEAVRLRTEWRRKWQANGCPIDQIGTDYAWVSDECGRKGVPCACPACDGHGSVEAYPGQRVAAEAWMQTEPPSGEGWQMWETTSEGSPISPVFATAEGLIEWMTTPAAKRGMAGPWSRDVATKWVLGAGWAPTMMTGSDGFLTDGITGMAETSDTA